MYISNKREKKSFQQKSTPQQNFFKTKIPTKANIAQITSPKSIHPSPHYYSRLLGYNSAQGLGQKLRMAKALDDRCVFSTFFPKKKNISEAPNKYLPGKQPLLLISINFTAKNSQSCLKKWYFPMFSRSTKKNVCLLNVARLVSLNRILDLEPKKGEKNEWKGH